MQSVEVYLARKSSSIVNANFLVITAISMTESSFSSGARNNDDIFKIMVATDIHLGYAEKHQILSE